MYSDRRRKLYERAQKTLTVQLDLTVSDIRTMYPRHLECAACHQTPCQAGVFATRPAERSTARSLWQIRKMLDVQIIEYVVINGNAHVQRCDQECPEGTSCVEGGCIPDSGV